MMKTSKHKTLYISVAVIIILLLIPLYLTTGQLGLIGDKAKIQRNVVEYLRVQHGWANEQRLEPITTNKYYDYICKNGVVKTTMSNGSVTESEYTINGDKMDMNGLIWKRVD